MAVSAWNGESGSGTNRLALAIVAAIQQSALRPAHATFTVYRGQASRNLMFDINLLTDEFQTVLSDALERAFEIPQEAGMLAGVAPVGSVMESAIATQRQ